MPPDGTARPEPARPAAAGLVTVVETEREFEAQALAVVLEEAGIQAFVFPSPVAPVTENFTVPGRIPVQVSANDLERAKAVLAASRSTGAAIDWNEVEVGDKEPDMDAGLGAVAHLVSRIFKPAGWAYLILGAVIGLPIALLVVAYLLKGR